MLLNTKPASILHSFTRTSTEEEKITASATIPENTITKIHISRYKRSNYDLRFLGVFFIHIMHGFYLVTLGMRISGSQCGLLYDISINTATYLLPLMLIISFPFCTRLDVLRVVVCFTAKTILMKSYSSYSINSVSKTISSVLRCSSRPQSRNVKVIYSKYTLSKPCEIKCT